MSTLHLVCSCGLKMKAPGAVPGRVGKCPRCGSLLKVPEGTPPPAPQPVAAPAPATFAKRKGRQRKGPVPRGKSDGLVGPPRIPESRWVDSLSYPFWNASGIALLVFMPPLLWFSTTPMIVMLADVQADDPVTLFRLVFLLPSFLLLGAVSGYVLLFLGRVLVTSSLGEVLQPRSPGWELSEITEGLGRWFWALVVGGVVGAIPALAYWISCGDVDLFDKVVLLDLILPGLAYAQMALLATLIHESPLAANPVTVTRAILRLGWSYAAPCAETGVVLLVLAFWFARILNMRSPAGQAVACWLFWVAALYAAMVGLRRLGLYCYRNAIILEWFPDRSRSAR